MLIKTKVNFSLYTFFILLVSSLDAKAQTANCPILNTPNPFVISKSCTELTLTDSKSGVTIQNGVSVTDLLNGVFPATEVRTTIGNFTNNGTISAVLKASATIEVSALKMYPGSLITTLNNNGTISALATGHAAMEVGGTIGTLNNAGTISSGWNAWALYVYTTTGGAGTVTTLNNTGTISSVREGIIVEGGGAQIGTINNSGTITGGSGASGNSYSGIAVRSGATIGTITNTGTITNGGPGFGISNSGTITTLNNQQSNLTLQGTLPVNYNTIINSTSNYGKLIVTSANGATNFGIYQGSVVPSGTTTYAAVLSGVTAANLNAQSGTYGGGLVATTWTLKNTAGTTWDLITSPKVVSSSPVVSGSTAGSSLANQLLVSYETTPTATLKNGGSLGSAVQSLTVQEVNQLAGVHAEGYSSNMTIGLEQMKTVANTVMDRIHRPISDSNSKSVSYELDAGRYVWADVAGFTGTVNSYNGLAGFGYNSYYGVVGVDLFRNQSGGIGVYGGAGNSYMTQSAQVTQNFTNNTGYVGLYGGMYLANDFKLSGAAGYSFGNSNASRYNPNIGNFTGGTASDSYSSNGAFAAIKLSHSMLLGEKFTLTPFIGGSYSQLNTGSVSETGGGDFNYSINAATSYQAITFAGAEFVQPLTAAGESSLAAVGFYRFSYNWSANTDSAHTVTATSSTFGTFNQTGANMGPVSNLFGLGLQGQLSKDVSLRVGAVAALNTNGTQFGGGGELKWRF